MESSRICNLCCSAVTMFTQYSIPESLTGMKQMNSSSMTTVDVFATLLSWIHSIFLIYLSLLTLYNLDLVLFVALHRVTLTITLIIFSVGLIWNIILCYFSNHFLKFIIYSSMIIWSWVSMYSLYHRNILFFVVGFFVILSVYYYYVKLKSRLILTEAILSTAGTAIGSNFLNISFITLFWMTIAYLRCLILCLVAYEIYRTFWIDESKRLKFYYNHLDDDSLELSTNHYLVMLLFGFACAIDINFTRYTFFSTISSVIGSWFFDPYRSAVGLGSLLRIYVGSHGTIFLGGLPVAFMQMLRDFVSLCKSVIKRKDLKESGLSQIPSRTCGVEMLWRWFDNALPYYDKYSFCLIAAYGINFFDAAKRALKLFVFNGMAEIANSNYVYNVLMMGILSIAAGSACIGHYFSMFMGYDLAFVGVDDPITFMSCFGFVIGFYGGVLIADAIDSSTSMIITCIAENAHALKVNHPGEFDNLRVVFLSHGGPDLLALGLYDTQANVKCLSNKSLSALP